MRSAALVCISVLIMDVPGPFDHGLRRAIEEDELGVKLLLQLQLCSLTHLKHKGRKGMKRVDEVQQQFVYNEVEKAKCITDQEDVCAEL